jgi:hypothetical protein
MVLTKEIRAFTKSLSLKGKTKPLRMMNSWRFGKIVGILSFI